ncbi:MAG TPA: hypothetical protein VGK49_01610 [Ilumatobacteraceae bacterium]
MDAPTGPGVYDLLTRTRRLSYIGNGRGGGDLRIACHLVDLSKGIFAAAARECEAVAGGE